MAFPKSSQILLLSVLFTTTTPEPTAAPVLPHIVDCFSANMETLRCRWSSGSLRNLSEPGALRLFYLNKPSVVDWLECPEYSPERLDECFFSEAHTTVWVTYRVQLQSRDQRTVYDESVFTVYERVRPDPPYNLSWAVLNSSVSGQYFDSLVSWSPPESADVRSGWMRLQYQLQHRDTNTDVWKSSDLLDSTHSSVYGLHTDVHYEVRVRCKVLAKGLEFGDFSDSIYIYNSSKGFRFPVAALLIFGALFLVGILMLVIISQQEKLIFLLLPPIPGPKIRGIDPELLKKGKLRELTSILGLSELRPELYSADPWEEFIELDLEETSDPMTHCMLPGSPHELCTPESAGFHDDDSGRESCCDPDLHSDAESTPSQPNAPEDTPNKHPALDMPLTQEAMYTQVSEVQLSGNVVLSPEEDASGADYSLKQKPESDGGGYTSDVNAGKISDVSRATSLRPAPAYTVVEAVDRQNGLLLSPNLLSSKPTPEGYLTPDLFGGITV
ncbi:growth hormone receptor-like isoform X2 [Eucyclogobius newberryi]|uniref:growth hormone receptor-like isoform X2 n=1 Tax=Eucyclogobius newberryi TaxID=166745 RepID=UPI003B5C4175